MAIAIEIAGLLLVVLSAFLIDWRLIPAVVGLFLLYVTRTA